jgi:3'-5' exoribonuclease
VAGKSVFIRDLVPGAPVSEVFLLTEARQGQARNGPFWSLRLEDASGSAEAKIWSPHSQAYEDLRPGSFAAVSGQAQLYRDKVQVNVERLELLDPEAAGLDMADFLASSARSPLVMIEEILELCRENLSYKPWFKFCRSVLENEAVRERLLAAPGAKSMHHAYRGGLLEHTLAVSRLCLSISALYPALDRETLLVAAVFHDLGKAWELKSDVTRDYTDEGRLLGHIALGLEILEPFLKKARELAPGLVTHFKHLLLSHHGEYAYGSPKLPMTAEAFILHFSDNMDAKLNTIGGLFPEDGDEAPDSEGLWSSYQKSLERQIFNPPRTPRPRAGKGADKAASQCLLPLKA